MTTRVSVQVVSAAEKSGVSKRTGKPFSFYELTCVVPGKDGPAVVKLTNDTALPAGNYTAAVGSRAGQYMAPVSQYWDFQPAK